MPALSNTSLLNFSSILQSYQLQSHMNMTRVGGTARAPKFKDIIYTKTRISNFVNY